MVGYEKCAVSFWRPLDTGCSNFPYSYNCIYNNLLWLWKWTGRYVPEHLRQHYEFRIWSIKSSFIRTARHLPVVYLTRFPQTEPLPLEGVDNTWRGWIMYNLLHQSLSVYLSNWEEEHCSATWGPPSNNIICKNTQIHEYTNTERAIYNLPPPTCSKCEKLHCGALSVCSSTCAFVFVIFDKYHKYTRMERKKIQPSLSPPPVPNVMSCIAVHREILCGWFCRRAPPPIWSRALIYQGCT